MRTIISQFLYHTAYCFTECSRKHTSKHTRKRLKVLQKSHLTSFTLCRSSLGNKSLWQQKYIHTVNKEELFTWQQTLKKEYVAVEDAMGNVALFWVTAANSYKNLKPRPLRWNSYVLLLWHVLLKDIFRMFVQNS